MRDLKLQQVGSSSLTRDQTWASCIENSESYPLDHQGSPTVIIFNAFVLSMNAYQVWGLTFLFIFNNKWQRGIPNSLLVFLQEFQMSYLPIYQQAWLFK